MPIVDTNASIDVAQSFGFSEFPPTKKLYMIGGKKPFAAVALTRIVEFDPITYNVTTKVETLPDGGRALFCSVYYPPTSKIYIYGGFKTSSILYTNTIMEYDPIGGSVTVLPEILPINSRESETVFFPPNNKIYILRGRSGAYMNTVFEHDPQAGTLVQKPETFPYVGVLGAAYFPPTQKIYMYGTNTVAGRNKIIEYEPLTGTVTVLPETLPYDIGGYCWAEYLPTLGDIVVWRGVPTLDVLSHNPSSGVVATLETVTFPSGHFGIRDIYSPQNMIYCGTSTYDPNSFFLFYYPPGFPPPPVAVKPLQYHQVGLRHVTGG